MKASRMAVRHRKSLFGGFCHSGGLLSWLGGKVGHVCWSGMCM